MIFCPECGKPVFIAAIENPRNGKWTALPLDELMDFDRKGSFSLSIEQHEAFDILGKSLGEFPVAIYHEKNGVDYNYGPHNPSHFLEPRGHNGG